MILVVHPGPWGFSSGFSFIFPESVFWGGGLFELPKLNNLRKKKVVRLYRSTECSSGNVAAGVSELSTRELNISFETWTSKAFVRANPAV